MTIYYLMVKTHINTGLKYLCQTTRKDPHTYLGSGKYWKRHLKIHGNEITTEIMRECKDKPELKLWGIYYSELWNVVENEKWANLKPETGDGGAQLDAARRMSDMRKGKAPWNKGVPMTENCKRKQ